MSLRARVGALEAKFEALLKSSAELFDEHAKLLAGLEYNLHSKYKGVRNKEPEEALEVKLNSIACPACGKIYFAERSLCPYEAS